LFVSCPPPLYYLQCSSSCISLSLSLSITSLTSIFTHSLTLSASLGPPLPSKRHAHRGERALCIRQQGEPGDTHQNAGHREGGFGCMCPGSLRGGTNANASSSYRRSSYGDRGVESSPAAPSYSSATLSFTGALDRVSEFFSFWWKHTPVVCGLQFLPYPIIIHAHTHSLSHSRSDI
jgi:hypothetical protein